MENSSTTNNSVNLVNDSVYDDSSLQKYLKDRFPKLPSTVEIQCFKSIIEVETKKLIKADQIIFEYNGGVVVRRRHGEEYIRYCDVLDDVSEKFVTYPGREYKPIVDILANHKVEFRDNKLGEWKYVGGIAPSLQPAYFNKCAFCGILTTMKGNTDEDRQSNSLRLYRRYWFDDQSFDLIFCCGKCIPSEAQLRYRCEVENTQDIINQYTHHSRR
jgi:hypothetical protein